MNQLKVGQAEAITTLLERGWSQRRIARELGIHRGTVGRYVRLVRAGPNPAISTPGSAGAEPSNPAIPTPGSAGRRSLCEPRDSGDSYRYVLLA